MTSMLSVPVFAAEHGISRSLFYKLLKKGRGPRITKIEGRTLISAEAAAEWRARMERETEQVPPQPKVFDSHPRRARQEVTTSGQEAA